MVTHDGIRPVSAEGARRATGDATAGNDATSVRVSAQRQTEVVLRRLRGAAMDRLARELHIPAARLAAWRDACLAGGQEALKQHPREARKCARARRRETLGESPRANALVRENIARVETGRPVRRRRSSRGVRPPRPPRGDVPAWRASVISGGPRSTGYGQRQARTGRGTRPGPQEPCPDDA